VTCSASTTTVERPAPGLGLLRFGNAVGRYELPHLPPVDVHTDKGGEPIFARMLADNPRAIAALPVAAGTGGAIPYDRRIGLYERVLYHAFVYLRPAAAAHPERHNTASTNAVGR
jgi:hypothetical protein